MQQTDWNPHPRRRGSAAARSLLELSAGGREVNRKRVQRLMLVMGLQALVPGPHTGKPHPEHPIYPYLLRGVEVTQPNKV